MSEQAVDRTVSPNVAEIADSLPPREGNAIREYLIYAGKATHAPPRYHLLSFLPCVCHMAVDMGIRVDVGEGRPRPPQLLVGLVGSSGSGKSTAAKMARSITQQALTKVHGGAKPASDPFLLADGSVEGVFHAMKDYHRPELGCTPVIAWQDEVTILLRSENFADMLCRAYDGEDVRRHLRSHQKAVRKGERSDGDEDVVMPVIQGIFATTSASLEDVATAPQVAGGLFGRINWLTEKARADRLLYAQPNMEHHERFVVQLLVQWMTAVRTERRFNPVHSAGTTIRFTPEADALVRDYIWAPLRSAIVDPGARLAGLYMRTTRNAKTIAAMYALASLRFTVEPEDVYAVVHLMQPLLESAHGIDRTVAQPTEVKLQDRLEATIKAAGPQGLARWQLNRTVRSQKFDRDRALWALMDQALIVEVKVPAPGKGRPSTQYVHVDCYDPDAIVPEQRNVTH